MRANGAVPPRSTRLRMSLLAILALIGTMALVWSIATDSSAPEGEPVSGLPMHSTIPAITLEVIGQEHSEFLLPSDRGRPMVLAFVSSRCDACLRDTPFWAALKEESARRDVDFALASIDQDIAQVTKYASDVSVIQSALRDVPMLFSKTVGPRFNIRFVPSYWGVDADGRLVWQSIGATPATTTGAARARGVVDAITSSSAPPLK